MTQKHFKNRNLPYTQGLRWDYTAIPMTDQNDGDVNAAIYDPDTNEIIFSCASMSAVFGIAMIFSFIYSREKMKLIQDEVLEIIHHYKGPNKKFVVGKRKQMLDDLRKKFMDLVSIPAHKLMNAILPLMEEPITVTGGTVIPKG